MRTHVTAGPLEEVVTSWDDLAPGPYRLRVTAADFKHVSQRDEQIVVRAVTHRHGR